MAPINTSSSGFYEALCVLHASGVSSTQKYEAARCAMKRTCGAMKRNLTASCFFAQEFGQKKWSGRRGSTRSVREHRSTNVREAQGNHTVKNHRGHEQ